MISAAWAENGDAWEVRGASPWGTTVGRMTTPTTGSAGKPRGAGDRRRDVHGQEHSDSTRGGAEPPRSLADDLRSRDDAALGELLRARPDLLSPVPGDVGLLAARAATRASTQRALDRLDRFTLQTVDVLCALPDPSTPAAVDQLLGADATRPLGTLRAQALVYGPDSALRVLRTVRELIGTPAGLGPPAEQALAAYGPARLDGLLKDLGLTPTGDPVAAATAVGQLLADTSALDDLLREVGDDARAVLDRLAWGPPTGRVGEAQREVTTASARTPVERLLARALLVATDLDTVVLPRQVALHLRGGRVHREVLPRPPMLSSTSRDPSLTDRSAGGSAFSALRLVESLLEMWGVTGPPVLRAGGLGVRELRRTATLLDVEEPVAALVVETAYVAGLLARSGEIEETWLPTPAYDVWRGHDTGRQWTTLTHAWLATTRVPGLVGGRDDRDRPFSALGAELDRPGAPEVRRRVLEELAALPPGTSTDAASLLDRLAWHQPRRGGRLRAELVPWTLHEAELLGVTGLGALSAPARALLAGDSDGAADALEPLLPQPLDHVLLQADLTAVAPGPLTTDLGRALGLMADVESTGGATVYRFTERSVRRALDAGRSAAQMHRTLAAHSRTPVPQPLSYLIDDVARRHGRIRVGTASSYLRADDEVMLDELVADRRSAGLGLRRLAPTVITAQAPVEIVLEKLRTMGYAPAAETAEGDLLIRRPDAVRAPSRPPLPQRPGEPRVPGEALVHASVRAVRAGDRAATAVRRPLQPVPRPEAVAAHDLPRTATADTLAAVQAAAEHGSQLWIGYVNAEGGASQRVIAPISVEGGRVIAFDHRHGEVRTFAVHRITGVAGVDSDEPA
jgi:hypothetical protein